MPKCDRHPDAAGLGAYIKRLRSALGLSQSELARRCELSPDTIRRLERDSFSPSLDTLCKLARGLGINVFELFAGFRGRQVPAAMIEDCVRRMNSDERAGLIRLVVNARDLLDRRPDIARDAGDLRARARLIRDEAEFNATALEDEAAAIELAEFNAGDSPS